ncbi:thiamine pyridinylase [Salidesulfovibrio onnuriiensis]|uniref:thiamine pyridinylase n=1 Tax=Salidesulfovibrio onnuriiensis TaxID=2583823 RepID=UPI0011CB7C60|nr:thiamine pyridinylase [Salidesulfovibrio onnuriiensis]
MKRRHYLAFVFGVLLALLLSGSVFAQTLKVALYPYVPRIEQFKQVISTAWAQVEPSVGIEWQDSWDGGYKQNPLPEYDLYVFDAMFLNEFNASGWLSGIPKAQVRNFGDLLPWAAKGVESGDNVLGIPQLGCTTVLFYHSDDEKLVQAKSLEEVVGAIGTCRFYDQTPPANVGLMTNFSSGSSNAGFYVQSLECEMAQYPVPLPHSKADVNPVVVNHIRQVVAMSSFKNGLYSSSDSYQRGTWFGQGHGRAYIGFTESLSRIPADQYANISCKVMPWANNPAGIASPLFYSDVIGVHPATEQRGTRDLALKLANLMASTEVVVNCFGPTGTAGPQYLMPTRASAFQALSQDAMYAKIWGMVQSVTPVMFSLGNNARAWVASMKQLLTSEYLDDAACYCDHDAGPIFNQQQAEQKCPGACMPYNGWNGQWTSKGGTSYCGCNQPCQ